MQSQKQNKKRVIEDVCLNRGTNFIDFYKWF